jgi:hypothetical protein
MQTKTGQTKIQYTFTLFSFQGEGAAHCKVCGIRLSSATNRRGRGLKT